VESVARQNLFILHSNHKSFPAQGFFCDREIDPSSAYTESICLLTSSLSHCVGTVAEEGGNEAGLGLPFIPWL
jgi:hypothetical protein